MAKAILEFNLDDSDDSTEFTRAVRSLDMALVLWEITTNMKKGIQNELEFNKKFSEYSKYDAVDLVFERIYDEMNERGLNMDQILT